MNIDRKIIFEKYQPILLNALKSKEVRSRLYIPSSVGAITKISPNSIHEILDINTYRGRFYLFDKFYYLLAPSLLRLHVASEEYDKRLSQDIGAFLHFAGYRPDYSRYPSVYLDTFDKNDALLDTGGSGWIKNEGSSWSTIRGASSGDGSVTIASDEIRVQSDGGATKGIFRGFANWDTSSMGAGATINSGFFDLTLQNKQDDLNDSFSYITIVSNNQADPESLVLGDFDQLGTTDLISSTLDITSLVVDSEESNITITAGGLNEIDPSGFTSFGVREGHDNDNQDPGSGNDIQRVDIYGNNAGSEFELNVDYTPAVPDTAGGAAILAGMI